ncbi:MAG: hypothetical protein ACI8XC_001086 [Gammaproteobacteria bacterium]
MRLTFENRETRIPEVITAFTADFIDSKQGQWAAFIKRLRLEDVPADFFEVVAEVDAFLKPVVSALINGNQVPDN